MTKAAATPTPPTPPASPPSAPALKNPDDNVILPEIISKEPLGPVVRHGDNQWGDIVRWTHYVTLIAEEKGITPANIDEVKAKNAAGTDGADPKSSACWASPTSSARKWASTNDWAYNVIKAGRQLRRDLRPQRRPEDPVEAGARLERALEQGRPASTPRRTTKLMNATRQRPADKAGRWPTFRIRPARRPEVTADVQGSRRTPRHVTPWWRDERKRGIASQVAGRPGPGRDRLVPGPQHAGQPGAARRSDELPLPGQPRRLPAQLRDHQGDPGFPDQPHHCWPACSTRCWSPRSPRCFATILGLIVGIARLVQQLADLALAGGYIELMRNIPLLLQLVFWYSAWSRRCRW